MDPRQELRLKHERIRKYLDRNNLKAVLLSRRCNFAWLTGGGQNYVNQAADTGVATLLAATDQILCLCPNIEADRIRTEELAQLDIQVISHPWWDPDEPARTLARHADPAALATDSPLPGLPDIRQVSDEFNRLRWQLTPPEIDRYRKLGAIVARQIEDACRSCRPGWTEHQIASDLTNRLNRLGVRTPVVLVAADDRIAAYRHPIPTDTTLRRCAMLVVCGEKWGLICSATRIVHFGRPPAELTRKHQAVCTVDARMIAATRPGRTLAQIFAEAQAAYAQTGWPDEWQLHHQGGPTGYLTREAKATPTSTLQVLSEQAFAWNPSITGTKSEDTILVLPDANHVLTATPDWPTTPIDLPALGCPRPDILIL